ncbi:hypothetical protein [Helicobacter pylori]|nr:hypothetical protein [Helicobacter pylori]
MDKNDKTDLKNKRFKNHTKRSRILFYVIVLQKVLASISMTA